MSDETLILVGVGAVGLIVLYYAGTKVIDAAAGAVTGDNALTQNQTNLAGEKTDAYEGMGIVGTLGAAANTASGGVLASVGETLGSWAFDVFGPKVYLNTDPKGPQ